MVGVVDVPMAMIKGSVITDTSKIINKYSRENTAIPEGSLFYQSAVVEKEDLQDSIIYDYPADEGYTLVNLSVTTDTTYGNKMYPGNYIDIYIKAVNRIDEENMTTETEDKIKEELAVTSRCMPFNDQEQIANTCVCCGKPAHKLVYWGKAY